MELKKVKDHLYLYRADNQAILNMDDDGFKKALERKKRLVEQQEIVKNNSLAISNLEEQMNHIQSMLEQVLGKLDGRTN